MSNIYESDFPHIPSPLFNFTGVGSDELLIPGIGTKAKVIEYGKNVEIVFQGTSILEPENHPMHLHGFSFYLVGTGYGNFDKNTSSKTYNLIDPPEVNTIGVPKKGWAAIRFVADNPGIYSLSLSLSLSLMTNVCVIDCNWHA